MMLRRMLEGALKCALRDLRLEEWRARCDCQFVILEHSNPINYLLALTLAIVMNRPTDGETRDWDEFGGRGCR